MPHLSKKSLRRKTFHRVSRDLIAMISGLESQREIKTFLTELLTPTERVMLAKRLAIIFMLKKNYSFETVWRTLKVSPSTVARFWKQTKTHSFHTISRRISNSLLAGMPPMNPRQAKHLYPYKPKQKSKLHREF